MIAGKAIREFGNVSPKERRAGKVGFENVPSPNFDRACAKDLAADDPRKRTDGIDRVLGGDIDGLEGFGDGATASLQDISRMNTRAMRQLQQEEEDRKQELLEIEKARLAEERDKNQKYFIDPVSKKQFDPVKKFGMIEGENELVYDNMTTSYALNLPPDYYLKAI